MWTFLFSVGSCQGNGQEPGLNKTIDQFYVYDEGIAIKHIDDALHCSYQCLDDGVHARSHQGHGQSQRADEHRGHQQDDP